MSARIDLDRPHAHFTNLDFLTGKVIVQLNSATSISSINVKLEGESRTRLAGPRFPGSDRQDKKKIELEIHKILYKVVTVFPSADVAQHTSPTAAFTLPPGKYEYPFEFKLPFNNACSNHNSMLTNLNMAGLKLEVARDTNRHVRKTLPPSLTGLAGEAEIQYYVKATVARPQFYKENIRAFADFNFLPIEPPRPHNPNEETYARRRQEFAKWNATANKRRLSRREQTPKKDPAVDDPPTVSAEARLPNPAILTCNEPIPLRILVSRLSGNSETLLLQLLHIELIEYTAVRAHDLVRRESASWVILTRSNMNLPLGLGDGSHRSGVELNSGMWNALPLPSAIAPSFETCNISRHYEMEVRVGLGRASMGVAKACRQPELNVLPLRLAVQVYSGIAPPQALLDAMASSEKRQEDFPASPTSRHEHESPTSERPPRPATGPHAANNAPQGDIYEEAPPSYEDAMADGIGPVDGPRREYNPPNTSTTNRPSEHVTDMKTPVSSERSNERLYAHSSMSTNSAESLDMLPTTPGSHPGSLPDSPVEPPGEAKEVQLLAPPTHPEPQPSSSSPGDKKLRQKEPSSPNLVLQRVSTASDLLTVKLGVPQRKPVPGDASPSRGATPFFTS
ncbi:hypothetical protein V8E54_003321 [Elaphomyces granulatus]